MTEPELYEFIILFKYSLLILASNVCKSDTSGSRLKVPFVIKLIKETTITLHLEYSPYNYNNSRILNSLLKRPRYIPDCHVVDSMGNHSQYGAESCPKNVLFRTCIAIHGETK